MGFLAGRIAENGDHAEAVKRLKDQLRLYRHQLIYYRRAIASTTALMGLEYVDAGQPNKARRIANDAAVAAFGLQPPVQSVELLEQRLAVVSSVKPRRKRK